MALKMIIGTLYAVVHSFWLMTTLTLFIAVVERWITRRFVLPTRCQPASEVDSE